MLTYEMAPMLIKQAQWPKLTYKCQGFLRKVLKMEEQAIFGCERDELFLFLISKENLLIKPVTDSKVRIRITKRSHSKT